MPKFDVTENEKWSSMVFVWARAPRGAEMKEEREDSCATKKKERKWFESDDALIRNSIFGVSSALWTSTYSFMVDYSVAGSRFY